MTDLLDQVHCSDNIEFLRNLPDDSIDSIVTDPPYGLSFMGKKWDYDVPSVDVWTECLRVLKPGGHLLAFAGTRTQHRMAVNIEDAGFEIRDMIAWVYGSGFPKSLDVSKAIDKGHGENRERQLRFTAWMRSTGITAEQINTATNSCMASHYLTEKSQPAIATADMFDLLRPYLPEVPEEIERLVCERTGLEWTAYKLRPVVGQAWRVNRQEGVVNYGAGTSDGAYNITAPATDEAHKWNGWGTALKPALEPITVARKPFKGTVAENVLKHGTGGINVDGCRVEGVKPDTTRGEGGKNGRYGPLRAQGRIEDDGKGRFPANLIHDGSDEVEALFPKTASKQSLRGNGIGRGFNGSKNDWHTVRGHNDNGSASRFFYCAKASKRDRDEGAERNHHPTVKPTDLMRYLCRLVTPPDGIILDPFAGSGSTGKAAILEYFRFIGIEREAEYCEIANVRIRHAKSNRRMRFEEDK